MRKKSNRKSSPRSHILTAAIATFLIIMLPVIIVLTQNKQESRTHAAGVVPLGPVGQSGSWNLVFDDEFEGTSVDTSKWNPEEGRSMNNVTTHKANVSVSGGNAILTLASSSSGADLCTCNVSGGFMVPVNAYAEARVYFPGSGTSIYNWPAWWISGQNWPADGEHDIAEGLGTLTVNYHSSSGSHNQGTIPGTWSNDFHTYGIYRKAGSADVYWDGQLVKTYTTDDTGAKEYLLLNVGDGNTHMYGTGSQIKVDYVRVWEPGDNTVDPSVPAPSEITPTFVCAGGTNCVPSESVTPTDEISPTDEVPTDTVVPTETVVPTTDISVDPSVSPCPAGSTATVARHGHGGGGFFQKLLQFFMQLLQWLMHLIGGGNPNPGGPTPTPTEMPSISPSDVPSDAPTDSPTENPTPSTQPCDPTPTIQPAQSNVHYGPDALQTFDFYPPANNQTSPAIILVHGGGWVRGDKQSPQIASAAQALAADGFAVFSMNYRLATPTQPGYPMQTDDLNVMTQYVLANGAQYDADTANINMVGGSAGAHLVSLAAEQINAAKKGTIRSVVSLSGPMDAVAYAQQNPQNDELSQGVSVYLGCLPSNCTTQHLTEVSPALNISASTCAGYFIINSQGEAVPVSQAQEMYNNLTSKGCRTKLTILPGTQHAFAYFDVVHQDIVQFLKGN